MNVKSVEQAQVFDQGHFTKRILFQEGEGTAFVLNFLPGQSLLPHKHPDSEVYFLVLQGEGSFQVDRGKVILKEQQALYCRGDEEVSLVNDGEVPLSLYVVLSRVPGSAYTQEV